MSAARAAAAAFVVAFAAALVAVPASAHPAGFTSINRYVGVECNAQGNLHIAYLLDFAELPSYSEFERLDANKDGNVSPEEQRAYLDARVPPLVRAWKIDIDGAPASVAVVGSSLDVREGERGMSILRIAAEVTASRASPLAPGAREVHVHAADIAFADRSGWREMAAADSPDALVVAGVKEDASEALAYGSNRGEGPPRVDQADFTFRLTASPVPAAASGPRSERPVVVDARLAQLSSAMRHASGSWTFSAIALGIALLLGALHALSPGHGKALAGAYLVGQRARPSQAFVFGATVTASHTALVFLVGGMAVAIERTVGSDRLLRGLELLSAAAVLTLGLVQLSRRWRDLAGAASHEGHHHPEEPGSLGSVAALGASSGLTPCPSALAILLTAVALHRVGLGLVLILAFSVGVAATLTATGLLVMWARRLLDRFDVFARVSPWLPVLSSAFVTVVGVLLCVSALSPAAR
ncbi:MAG TPA: sulfite exporter TauE/SafE family protein [Polyangiaceae bacterium]